MAVADIRRILRAYPAGRSLLSQRRVASVCDPAAHVVQAACGEREMLTRLAVLAVRRQKVILIAVLALLGVSIVFGAAVSEKLGVGGFVDPASESAQVADFL